jgi:hypothetical protein
MFQTPVYCVFVITLKQDLKNATGLFAAKILRVALFHCDQTIHFDPE